MKRPILLVVMDGIGISQTHIGDAVGDANTPTLDRLFKTCSHTAIKAHGRAVGLPSDEDMGNSEVGHNALGCGQIYSQGARLVNESIESGKMFLSATWKSVIGNCVAKNSTLHFIGLLSDGNALPSRIYSDGQAGKESGVRVCAAVGDVPSTPHL